MSATCECKKKNKCQVQNSGLIKKELKWCSREVGSTVPLVLIFSHLKGAGLAAGGYRLPSPFPWQNHMQRCLQEML